jgi:AraC-like DNA-binding protein
MTQRPASLPDRPNRDGEDPLSEILRAVRFTRAVYYTVNAALPWPTILVPPGRAIASGLGPRTQNVLSYHVLVEGSCWTGLDVGDPVKVEQGDVIVFPRGDQYFLASDLGPRPEPDAPGLVGLLQAVSSGQMPPRVIVGPEQADRTRFVCGFLGCDPRLFDPLLRTLPPMLHVRGLPNRLRNLVDLALAEVDGAGGASVRERLSESMFIETVRQYLTTIQPEQAGLVTGLRDPVVGRALAILHGKPAGSWTLASLAKQAGVSRSVLAERFTKLVGQPPMQYLTQWRMQTAAHLLAEGAAKVAEVAVEVGYDSEAAFSRAFKKATGIAPAAWRESRSND